MVDRPRGTAVQNAKYYFLHWQHCYNTRGMYRGAAMRNCIKHLDKFNLLTFGLNL